MEKKENKFLVVKWEWLAENLNATERTILKHLLDKGIEGKPEHSYYVVNEDEPYAEKVWELIKKGEEAKEKMERRHVSVQYPVLDHTESIAHIGIEETPIGPQTGNKITIDDAFFNKRDSLFIVFKNTGLKESMTTIKAGNAYPNSWLGDLQIQIPKGVSAMQIQDLSRFEKLDDSIDLDFDDSFVGTIYAVAKWAGIKPVG